MTLSIFVALALLSALLLRKGHRRSGRLLAAILVMLFLGVGYGPVPYWCATKLQSGFMTDYHGQWGARSVIVLLGGGTEQVAVRNDVEPNLVGYARITRAYAQYASCKQQGGLCIVLVTGGDPQAHRAAEAVIYGMMLRRLGVPASDVVTEEHSRNTWENAKFSQPLIQAIRADTVVLVTSGTHLYRSQLYFSHFGIIATPVRADYAAAIFKAIPVFVNFALMDVVVHEYAGVARYYVYQLLGLN
jgi:uncharacterized SAM-binding protein YcdF (DUF218 family)